MDLPIEDKVAVVLHGIVGGMSGRNGLGELIDLRDCYDTLKYSVLDQYDCDIFAHSWSIENSSMIINLYNPTACLFQPQEYFGFSEQYRTHSVEVGQAYRTISRYTSMDRAMKLKYNHELNKGWRYKWVLAIRYDLVFFTKIDLSVFDDSCLYVCSEPHWPGPLEEDRIHDIFFLANSNFMDQYAGLGKDLCNNKFLPHNAHASAYLKAAELLGDRSKIRYGVHRYNDVEIYRMVVDPSQNTVGHAYGALETKNRMETLLKTLR